MQGRPSNCENEISQRQSVARRRMHQRRVYAYCVRQTVGDGTKLELIVDAIT